MRNRRPVARAARHAMAAVRAGKDLYVEKPLGMSIHEVKVLRDAVHRFGRIFQFGTQQRSSAEFRQACEIARNGREAWGKAGKRRFDVIVTDESMPVMSGRELCHELRKDSICLFYTCYLLCLTGLLGIVVTGDTFNLFVFLEIASLSSYVLISQGCSRRALTALLAGFAGGAAAADSPVRIHAGGNLLKETVICRGEPVDQVFAASAHVVEGVFETPCVEHAFLETEASIARPDDADGVTVYSQSQGIFSDRQQIASLLDLPEEKVDIVQVSAGGGFGGKEDLTVQHHAALYAMALQRPVKVRLNRAESIRMHPKRHRMQMNYKLACDERGKLTALRARIVGDTGAYASVGGEVVARTGTHAAAAYHVPSVDVVASAYYTNNPPAGAFRGFGVNQSNFAMESLVDELCIKGGFDHWQFRYDNILTAGSVTTTGHVLGEGVGLRQCLEAVKDAFYQAEYAGIACAIKNCGIGNGLEEISDTRLKVVAPDRIELCHGWTEMGQGIHTVARQVLAEVAGLDDSVCIDVKSSTGAHATSGTTTASRGTVLLGNSIVKAAHKGMT